jgi:hypothetical protein
MRHPLAVLLLIAAGSLAMPLAAAIPASQKLAFEVLRGDSRIGRHEVAFRREGEELHVEVAIDLEVKLAFVTVFTYRHRNHEVWREGRLVSLESVTDDDGKQYNLTGRATPEGFRVEGWAGSYLAPAGIIPTSYWNPATRYRMTGDLNLDLWYGPEGQWSRIAFDARGKEVVYRLTGDRQTQALLKSF